MTNRSRGGSFLTLSLRLVTKDNSKNGEIASRPLQMKCSSIGELTHPEFKVVEGMLVHLLNGILHGESKLHQRG